MLSNEQSQVLQQQNPMLSNPNSTGGYIPTLIDKMKEDILKLKQLSA